MKTKNFLIAVLFGLSLSINAQSTVSNEEVKKNQTEQFNTTQLNFESNNLEDFSTLYWDFTKEILKKNDPNQEFKLTIVYNNSSTEKKSQKLIDGFDAEFVGKTSELIDLMTSDMKNSLATLAVLDEGQKN